MKFRKNLRAKKLASEGIAKAGFTLIELIVVIAILGILVLLAGPRFLGYTKDANVSTMQADAKVLANSALVYNIENDTQWPTTGSDLEVTVGAETGAKFKALDPAAIKDHVQTLKGDVADYALVTEGSTNLQVGDIVYVADEDTDGASDGVEDRDGNTHFGTGLEVAKVVTP